MKGSVPDSGNPDYRYIYTVKLQGGRDVKAEVGTCLTGGAPGFESMATPPAGMTNLAKFGGIADCYNESMLNPATGGTGLALKGTLHGYAVQIIARFS